MTYSEKYIIIHVLRGDLLSSNENVIFWRFFIISNILNVFVWQKKWQISKPKIVDWYLDFTKESYTTLKSVISSFKICFQNYGQLKRKFLRPKITSSTFLKFELSSLSGPMLKTRKNTKRNQFQQQWFDVISFHKPRCVYPAISYNLKSFAHKKGKFTLSTLAKCTSHVFKVCQRAKRYNKPDKLQQSQRFCV